MAWTIEQMKAADKKAGKYWFSPGALRFFSSRISRNVYSAGKGRGQFFVSSERFDESEPRMYTVRRFDPQTSDVNEAEGHTFMEYASNSGAQNAAKRAAEAEAATPVNDTEEI